MYEKEDHEFFDVLYQQWSKTTGAEKFHYVVERAEEAAYAASVGFLTWNVVAVNTADPEQKWLIASFLNEEDADFVAGLHGAIPELIRRLHDATDEAVRKDEERDRSEGLLAEAYLEIEGLKAELYEVGR